MRDLFTDENLDIDGRLCTAEAKDSAISFDPRGKHLLMANSRTLCLAALKPLHVVTETSKHGPLRDC